jgi:hypothetical protein
MKPATVLLRIGAMLLVVMLCVQRPTLSVKAATDVQVKHVYLVVVRPRVLCQYSPLDWENHSYSSTIGNKSMPWLNALASRYAVVAGPDVKKAYVSTTLYQHQSTLRLLSEAMGVTSFPGAAATAPDMEEFIIGD